ncbi:uncharacterized protein BT62DRAFT_933220 [Guyanagaster necrorhizus]|uniref:Uncharacterized protein n=1 Tax=Guyanagaster necrorhizus TaxID=856835 RepID=A0A9P7VRY7_9AGAR|nr:uncharacterized protein BT62DRAFT_933220 [Guyanagaster necrorhizus MCA 3950]KAG7445380.1 hypothetical protein BT62DRAFT_933220 [Guyanagaster necrorhizus MCA 3950]
MPPRIRRLTYPIYYPEQNIPQYDVIPYTHLDELFLVGASKPEIPVPDIQNITRLRLLMTTPWRSYPVDACKDYDELTDWLIHLLRRAQGGCLKEVQLEYDLIGISGSPDKWAELDAVLSKMELSRVELVFSATPEEWDEEGEEKAEWLLWEGELEGLTFKGAAFFEQVERRGLLTVSRRYLS